MPIAGLCLTAAAALAALFLGVASASAAAADRAPAAAPSVAAAPQPATADAADSAAPNCLLPGQIRSLGGIAMVTARRPVTLPPADCAARGGELIASDA